MLKASLSEIFGIEFLLASCKIIDKHNWLNEYLVAIRKLGRVNQVDIIDERKTLGSFFHDKYKLAVWEKLDV